MEVVGLLDLYSVILSKAGKDPIKGLLHRDSRLRGNDMNKESGRKMNDYARTLLVNHRCIWLLLGACLRIEHVKVDRRQLHFWEATA